MALDRETQSSELATLVAGMAHEINNPITYVLGNLRELGGSCAAIAETLAGYRRELRVLAGESAPARIADLEAKLRDAGGLELVDELVTDAADGAARIRDLMRDLLSVSRSASQAVRAPVQLEVVLEQTLRLVARPLGARAELERDFGASRAIQGDAAQLGQVFLNLLSNALDACAAVPERAHRICVRTRDVAGAVRVEIDDSGAGIHPDEHARVFEPFFTTKPTGAGTGLGLYLSRRIVREHGGEIGFETLERGTRFWAAFPAS